jgi:hypothetical protein
VWRCSLRAVGVPFGYRVVSFDGSTVGHVVGETEDALIVERGRVWRSRRALPRRYAKVDEACEWVRLMCSKELLAGSPKVRGERPLEPSVFAEYWGIE